MAVVFEGTGRARPRHGPVLKLDLPPSERAAGWNRAIAPSTLCEVEICPTFLSDDAHTIGLPPRATQPSVGRFVREIKHYRDASYGSHFGLYSGVNLLPVFGECMKTVPTVPRTHHHFGTGVNGGFDEPKLHPAVGELKLLASRADWVPAPSAASAQVVKLGKVAQRQRPPREHQALFPFPKNANLAHCEPDSGVTPSAKGCTGVVPPAAPPATDTPMRPPMALPSSPAMWSTPFWYNGSLARPGRPVGDPVEYGYCRQPQRLEGRGSNSSPTEGSGQGDQGCYNPGQIANEKCSLEPEAADASKGEGQAEAAEAQGAAPAARARHPLYERRIVSFRPPHEHYQLDPWIGQDRAALEGVGQAFKAGVCAEHYANHPPGPQPAITLRRCDYPDIRLSVL